MGAGEDQRRRAWLDLGEGGLEFFAGDLRQSRRVDVELPREPVVASHKAATRILFSAFVEKTGKGRSQFLCRARFAMGGQKELRVVDEAFDASKGRFVMQQDVPVAVLVQPLLFGAGLKLFQVRAVGAVAGAGQADQGQ